MSVAQDNQVHPQALQVVQAEQVLPTAMAVQVVVTIQTPLNKVQVAVVAA